MKFVKSLVCILLFVHSAHISHAQNPCNNALYEANQNFEKGNIQACINRLEACVINMKSIEKVEAYRLLTLSYLELKNETEARKNVLLLLKSEPQYSQFPHVDPLPMNRLISQYSITPKIVIGMQVGLNQNFAALKKSYSTYLSLQRYKVTTGFQMGASCDYYIKPKISVAAQFSYSGVGINHEVDSAGGWRQNYSEQQKYLGLNLSGNYETQVINRVKIRLGAGLGTGYLTQSTVFMESTNQETGNKQQDAQNPINMRYRWQPYGIIHAGIFIPVSKGLLGIESSYYTFFRNTVNPSNRTDDLGFNFRNQYMNDDISLRSISFLLSFKLPISWNIQYKKP